MCLDKYIFSNKKYIMEGTIKVQNVKKIYKSWKIGSKTTIELGN